MHTATLTQFGLSDKEAKVYASLLALGTVEASKIAAKASLNRSSTYVLLDSLAKRGLVESSRRGSIQLFTASQPEKLTEMAEAEIEKFTKLVKVGKELIPALKALSAGDTSKPKVRVVEGGKSLKSLYEEVSTTRSVVSAMLPSTHDPELYLGSLNNRANKSSLRAILPSNTNLGALTSKQVSSIQDLYTLPIDNPESELFIFHNTIALVSGATESACLIEDKGFAKIVQSIFDAATTKAQKIALKTSRKSADRIKKTPSREHGEKEKVLADAHKRFWSAD